MPMPKKPLGSDRFGRLAIITSVNGGWLCKCDCGTEKVVSGSHLRSGAIVSCGCFHAEQQKKPTKHGKRQSRIYIIWLNMIQRCTNKNNSGFVNYGARGIVVCDDWRNFENFYADMGDPPRDMSIDRIDNDKGYSKDNCRWATVKQQAQNKRTTFFVEIDGETKSLTKWCSDLDLNYWTVYSRIRRGVSAAEAMKR
jgi:hypothetical protein